LRERAFALAPLAEIDPTFSPLLGLLDEAARSEVVRIVPAPTAER
jgi:hypothetical protein